MSKSQATYRIYHGSKILEQEKKEMWKQKGCDEPQGDNWVPWGD